jgi:hypothetical protein
LKNLKTFLIKMFYKVVVFKNYLQFYCFQNQKTKTPETCFTFQFCFSMLKNEKPKTHGKQGNFH